MRAAAVAWLSLPERETRSRRGRRSVGAGWVLPTVGRRILPALAALLATSGAGCRRDALPAELARGLAMVPSDAAVVVRLDVARLRTTPYWPRIEKALTQEPLAKENDDLVRRTGLDLRKQLDSIVFAAAPGGEPPRFLLVGEGTFDEKRLVAAWRESLQKKGAAGVTETTHRGVRVYQREGIEVAFPGPHTAIAGSQGWTRRALDLRAGVGEPFARKPGIQPVLRRLPEPAVVWAVGELPAEARSKMRRGRLGTEVSAFTVRLDLARGIDIVAWAVTPSQADARKLADFVRQSLSEGRLFAGVFGLGPLLDAVRTTTDGAAVKIAAAMDQKEVDRMTANAEQSLARLRERFGAPEGPGAASLPSASQPTTIPTPPASSPSSAPGR